MRENPRRGRGRGLEDFEDKEAERRGGAMKLWFGRNNEFAIKRFFSKEETKESQFRPSLVYCYWGRTMGTLLVHHWVYVFNYMPEYGLEDPSLFWAEASILF